MSRASPNLVSSPTASWGPTPRGFVLLPVALALALVAVLVYTLNRQSSDAVESVAKSRDSVRVQYVAEAGLAHALWRVQRAGCAGEQTLATTAFGAESYTATVTAGNTTTAYSLSADQDAWIGSDNPDDHNGDANEQHVSYAAGSVEYSLYRFDLASLPANARINSASAWLYVRGGGEHPQGPLTVHRITADWTEAGVTWNSFADGFDPPVLATVLGQSQADVWVRVNLTAQVQAWVNGEPNYGILLASDADGVQARYASREGGADQQPRLEVVVGTGAVLPASIESTGTLANGVARTLSRTGITVLQPVSYWVAPTGVVGLDTYASSSGPDNNYGSQGAIKIGDTGTVRYTLIRYDPLPIPAGAEIVSAGLALNLESVSSAPAGSEIGVYRMLEPWTENGATYDTSDGATVWAWPANYDAANPADTVSFESASPGRYVWEVKRLVEGWASNGFPNYGLVLAARNGVSNATFTSGDDPNPDLHPKLRITYACECDVACVGHQGSGSIMLVVRDATNMWVQDADKKDLFESWGYTVNVIDDDATVAEFDTAIAGNDVAYVSDTSLSASVNTKLTDAAIGVVSEDGALNDKLAIASGYANPVFGDSIDITDNSHYITTPFAAGALRVYAAPMEGLVATNPLAGDLQTLGRWGTEPGLATVEFAAALVGAAGPAAGRRVLLPFGRQDESGLDWNYLNNNARLIVHRAIDWAAGAAGLAGPLAHWKLDDASGSIAVDSQGGHDATLTGSTWTTGYLDGGLEFADSDDIVEAGSDASLDEVFAGGATLSAWIEPSGWGGGNDGRIADKADAKTGNRNGWMFGLRGANQSLVFRHGFSGALGAWHTPTNSITLDSWQHVAVVYDNESDANDPVLYVNGVEQALTEFGSPSATPSSDAASDFDIGNHALGSNRAFEGLLDDVRVYDRMLSAGEVALLAAEGGAVCSGTYRDEFNARTYSGNNGSLEWVDDWSEINEGDGPTSGDEQVKDDQSDYQLQVKDNDGGGEGVERGVNLAGATSVTLRFDYRRSGLDNVSDYVAVEVSSSGGGTWTELDRFEGPGTDGSYQSVSYDISTHIAWNARVRFVGSPSLQNSDKVFFDNVEIQCAP